MKAISKRQHRAIISALQQLNELEPADGFLSHIQSLSERYSQYETLLVQLAECIAEYEAMQKDIRVTVVAPALRQAKKTANPHTRRYREIQGYTGIYGCG